MKNFLLREKRFYCEIVGLALSLLPASDLQAFATSLSITAEGKMYSGDRIQLRDTVYTDFVWIGRIDFFHNT